jgi:hypothetical protein
MSKSSTRPVAGSKRTAAEKGAKPKVAKVKTAVCITPKAMGHVDAACAVHQMTQSELFEFLIDAHLSGYYATVPDNRRIIKLTAQASPAIPAVTEDRPESADGVSQTAASPT